MEYSIQIDSRAARYFATLPKKMQRRIAAKIDSLKTQPHPPKSKKLKGAQNLYRIRSGDYRIIYSVIENKVTICILKIGDRKDVYK